MKDSNNTRNLHEENARQFNTMWKNLKSLREKEHWTLETLSQLSSIDVKILTEIENGKDFDIEHLFTLYRLYSIKVHEIFLPLREE